jgi:hypothetical protein
MGLDRRHALVQSAAENGRLTAVIPEHHVLHRTNPCLAPVTPTQVSNEIGQPTENYVHSSTFTTEGTTQHQNYRKGNGEGHQ